jgi:hypothetical protein
LRLIEAYLIIFSLCSIVNEKPSTLFAVVKKKDEALLVEKMIFFSKHIAFFEILIGS